MDISLECIHFGKLEIWLRGNDIRDAETGRKLPARIEYTSFKVNSQELLEHGRSVWHDAPFHFECAVQDGDTVNVHLSWQPEMKDANQLLEFLASYQSSQLYAYWKEERTLLKDESSVTAYDASLYDDHARTVHFSALGMCVPRDILGMKNNTNYPVDRFIMDINPLSLAYGSPLGGGRRITEENIKNYLVEPDTNHFHMRNTLLDLNKTAFQYLGEVKSDYLLLDVACLRFPLFACVKRHTAMSKNLIDRLKYTDEKQGV